ncbi:uncharacterized protein AMSG_10968 [Thecamonas trahens ATCC 50062]|uniref:Uncharacterized protein n=1 Tax=Thecamonas trahens ATCC 50062 TaxID=461836 RepID=A0A0L0DSX1_THETB|nr:hypothetical protein AMSG_10968 [Thecamonas trahens ATCC 50062]KNC55322.1 hypothetical protein AMSG_10968 [Thecamonas trahens ATCC 50062]|eukprot:XP_013753045.1 hypothetical protein AMSG_10968 [Thecamonas trahens ATCC 50062]
MASTWDWEYVKDEHLPLLEAIRDGDEDGFYAALAGGGGPEEEAVGAGRGTATGPAPLAAAVLFERPAMAEYLLDDVAVDVESRARGDDWAHTLTPLLLAAHVGHDAMADLLLARNADPAATTIGRDDGELDAAAVAAAAGHDALAATLSAAAAPKVPALGDTVGELKLVIASQTGPQPMCIRLQKADRVYKDHIILADYEIPDVFNFEMFYN